MSLISYIHNDGDGYVTEQVDTGTQVAEMYGHLPYRILQVVTSDGQHTNDGSDTEKVAIEVVSGLDVARGDPPTVLDYDGEVTLSVDGQQATKIITNGSVEFDVTTDKPAGSEIEIVAESLADHPAESDNATIEVVSQ